MHITVRPRGRHARLTEPQHHPGTLKGRIQAYRKSHGDMSMHKFCDLIGVQNKSSFYKWMMREEGDEYYIGDTVDGAFARLLDTDELGDLR